MMENSDVEQQALYAKYTALALLVALVVGLAFQGSRGLFETTEGRYAESAREMLETGNWLIPQLDYHPHWTKPPLTYWGIAGGMAALGVNEWGARIFLVAVFVILTWTVGRIGTLMWDRRTGFVSTLLFAVAPFAVYAANSVNTDLLLAMWDTLMVLCYLEAQGSKRARMWMLAMWLCAGLAFLTKGPPGLLILFSLVAYQFYLKRTGRPRVSMFVLAGVPLFLIVGGAWFVIVIVKTPGLLSYFLGEEVYQRVFTAHFKRNPQWYGPIVVYLPPLLFGTLPFCALWVPLIKRYRSAVRWKGLRELFRSNDRFAFIFLWLAIPLVLLSISRSRLPLYVLPIFPAVVLASARALVLWFDGPVFNKKLWKAALIMGAVLIVAKGATAYVPIPANMRQFHARCEKAREGDTAFYAYESNYLHGLQFYFGAALTRLWETPEAGAPESGIDTVIDEAKTHPKHDTYAFLTTSSRNYVSLTKHLDASGLAYKPLAYRGHYAIFVVHPKAGK